MLVTTQCASYCRYCTRSRIVGNPAATFSRTDFEAQLGYLQRTPQIRDVLLSGGDPLTLAPKLLEELLSRLRAIEHIEILRIGTRVPVFLPMRVDEALTAMLAQYHPLWINIHVNHPNEITAELAEATDRLTRAGIPLGNQSVLLAGINDCPNIQRRLVQDLVRLRVRPYYLYQCDLVEGAGHFRTPVSKGIEIIEALRGHTSGYAVPTFVVDAPGGGGKIPLMPNYLLSQSDHRVVLRNYEGFLTAYAEPTRYAPHNPAACQYCKNQGEDTVQAGVASLLQGERRTIRPQGFDELHDRNGGPLKRRIPTAPLPSGQVLPDRVGPPDPPAGSLPPVPLPELHRKKLDGIPNGCAAIKGAPAVSPSPRGAPANRANGRKRARHKNGKAAITD
jgi:lysine 2,3-aminomutase